MTAEADAAVTRTLVEQHIHQDNERFAGINQNLIEIKGMLASQLTKMENQAVRIHSRIESVEKGAREDTENVATIARSEAKLALDVAKDAGERVLGTKIWVLTGLVAGLIAIITTAINYFRH